MSIPGQLRGTSAIYGNIDDTLVAATTRQVRFYYEIIDKEYGRPLMQPDKLVRVTDKGEQTLDFPFRRKLNYIYHDKKNRLYIGAEGTRFEWTIKGNERTYPTSTDTAIIYISKLPISAQ